MCGSRSSNGLRSPRVDCARQRDHLRCTGAGGGANERAKISGILNAVRNQNEWIAIGVRFRSKEWEKRR